MPGMLKSNIIEQHQSLNGRHHYNNGKISILCKEDEVPAGFVPGMLRINKHHTKGWGWYNNGEINTRAPQCPEGFVAGKIKRGGH